MKTKRVEQFRTGQVDLRAADAARPASRGAAPRITAPAAIRQAGEQAEQRYTEFFTAQIRNRNTRAAYWEAARQFFAWCEDAGLSLALINPIVVATYIEGLMQGGASAPTVKQHLAALRSLFDWLVIGQVIPHNPAAAVRGPKHSVRRGKTPVREPEELRRLFASLSGTSLSDLRDRALLAILLYSFARVSAVCRMNVEDYFAASSRRMVLRLHEKGGKYHEVPAHHLVIQYVDEYLAASGLTGRKALPLFQSIRSGRLTGKRLKRQDAWALVKRRCIEAGIPEGTTCHSFRASGITIFLKNGGSIEQAATIANHESPRTTKLYDRRSEEISQTEIERVRL